MVFMGTPDLAAHVLVRLAESQANNFRIVGVVTRPDRPRDRGLRLEISEVAAAAMRLNLPILKPVKIRNADFLAQLGALTPDLLVIAAYGRILPDSILAAARLMPINLHASLLPRYRGAAPVESAILAGDKETGVTIMRVTSRMDSGPILLQRPIPIAPEDTQASLKMKLAELGASALLDAIGRLGRDNMIERAQDESQATYTSPIKKEDAIIDWRAGAVQIERMTRAYDPWPIARTTLGHEALLVYRASAGNQETDDAEPGTIVSLSSNPIVRCGRGRLILLEVQAPGRRRMSAADFMRGRRIAAGQRLGI
ncbi:MAG: methionyl-tRNA formyltransferase [Candidatus Binataceae bacterium]